MSQPGELLTVGRRELRGLATQVEQNDRISPHDFDRVMQADLQKRIPGNRKIEAVSAALFAGYIATQTAYEMQGDNFPDLATLPAVVDTALRVTYNLLPIGEVDVPSATLGDHTPMIMLTAALGYTVGETVRKGVEYLQYGGIRNRLGSVKERLQQEYADGTVKWTIRAGSTVAIVGNGDPLATQIAKRNHGDIVQIAQQKADGPWVHLPESVNRDTIMDALHRADVGNAGEVLVMPTTASQEFLPGPKDYEMTVGRVVHYIEAIDEYCDEAGIDRKPVVVVGNKEQPVTYKTVIREGVASDTIETTLRDRLELLADERRSPIEILDPTEIVMARIIELAAGRNIAFAGTEESIEEYQSRFFSNLREAAHAGNPDLPPVRVWYGKKDFTTANETTPDDIAVIIDPGQKPALIRRNIPPERILVVADEVLRVATPML